MLIATYWIDSKTQQAAGAFKCISKSDEVTA
jgi:hypothetical protein